LEEPRLRYRFDRFELQVDERRLLEGGAVLRLRPLAFDVLSVLVDRAGSLVTKEELRRRVWGTIVVEENTVQAHVSALRKVVGAHAIDTVSGQGYRFTLDVVATQPGPRTAAPPKNNLPQALTNFIGREREIEEVRQCLVKTRALTLTGAGGCGKTRLALQVARAALDNYPDGVWLVELAPLADPTLIGPVLAKALGLEAQAAPDLIDTVIECLGERRLLLVLDNAEHLIGACARLAERLLRRCRGLTLLTTSRERLGIDGELTCRVPSLSLPMGPSAAEVLASEAGRLFVDRVRLQQPDFDVRTADLGALAAICHRLDGIALAIELAVPRLRVMSMANLNLRLDDRFAVLAEGPRNALPRHRTLRSLVDWSYELLTVAERAVLRRASAFAGGWALEAAERVCAWDGVEGDHREVGSGEVPALLTSLVDKSLVHVKAQGGEMRFGMLETVRRYAHEHLCAAGEETAAQVRHLAWLVELAAGLDEPDGAAALLAASRLDPEHDNLRAVLAWCAGDPARAVDGLQLAGLLGVYWEIRGARGEEIAWLDRLLAAAPMDVRVDLRARALNATALCQIGHGDMAEARASARQAMALCRQVGDRRWLVRSLALLGEIDLFVGDHPAARRHLDEALSLAREAADVRDTVYALAGLAHACCLSGDFKAAQGPVQEALDSSRAVGCWLTAQLLLFLGSSRRGLGDLEGAHSAWSTALDSFRACRQRGGIAVCLNNLAKVSLGMGDTAAAWAYWRESSDWLPGGGNSWVVWLDSGASLVATSGRTLDAVRLWGCVQRFHELRSMHFRSPSQVRAQEVARRALDDDATFDRTLAEGMAWTLDEGVRRAQALDEEICARRSP